MIKYTSLQNINTRYYDSEKGDTAVLFLHGWGAPLETYQSIFSQIEGKYRVIAPETPGCGKTGEPPEGWNVDKYVSFVLDFCKSLGIKSVVLMGHSFGVRLIIKLLALHSENLECQKAVIIDGAGIVPKRSFSYYCKVYSYKLCKKIIATKIGSFFFLPLWEERKRNIGSKDYAGASDIMKHTLSLVVNEDLKHLMPKINAEVYLIWGENDDDTPLSDGKSMESLIPKSGLSIIQNAGHYPFLENPGAFFSVLSVIL